VGPTCSEWMATVPVLSTDTRAIGSAELALEKLVDVKEIVVPSLVVESAACMDAGQAMSVCTVGRRELASGSRNSVIVRP
jgi:formylmethanofuran dehydrogenase subunit E